MARDFDLFGTPLPRNLGKVGRNEHVPTPENVSRIRQLLLAGWNTAKIAEEIGISRPTLRKHYLPDIEKGRVVAMSELRAKTIARLDKAADGGNVAAMKELLRVVGEAEINAGIGHQPAEPSQPTRVGKKEQAVHDAQTADQGTEWQQLLRH